MYLCLTITILWQDGKIDGHPLVYDIYTYIHRFRY